MASSSISPSTSTSASPSATTSVAATLQVPPDFKILGVILAIASGVLIGSSFVFKKKGLLRSQKGGVAGEGVAYLKSPLWWTGMTMMILGELCNFAAYAFVEAIVVTPMGALSVVICAILSSLFLNEKLTLFGWLGCGMCIIGSVIIALNGPSEPSVGQIVEFQHLFLGAGFLVYGSILVVAALFIIFWVAPRYGKTNMIWYILVCSMIGGISVSVTTGLGSAIVTTAMGDNQFKHWFIYFLMVFIAVTLITEVYYLNVALALFNTAMVTPTYYVIFTFFSILTTIVLFRGLAAPATQIITLVMGFLVICVGITVLQLSKIDPAHLESKAIPGLDRRSTMLLQAARSNTKGVDEKDIGAMEDPGMDTLRGSFGAMGSIIRARSARMSTMSSGRGGFRAGDVRTRHGYHPDEELPHYNAMGGNAAAEDRLAGMKRHQLYDPPVQRDLNGDAISLASTTSPPPSQFVQSPPGIGSPTQIGSPRKLATIKFGNEDIIHSYPVTGREGEGKTAIHEHRSALRSTPGAHDPDGPYAPLQLTGVDSRLSLALDTHDGLRSAPPIVYEDPYRTRLPAVDPFANSPSTTTTSTFPSMGYSPYREYTNSTHSSSTTGATVGFGTRDSRHDEDGMRRGLQVSASPSPLSPPQQHSEHPHLDRLFGRSRSSSHSRHYPKGDSLDDKEESESLVQSSQWRPSFDDREPESASRDPDMMMHPQPSVRLVTPPSSASSDSASILGPQLHSSYR